MIRKSESSESAILTEISFTSKHFWPYPQSYFDIWENELTITEVYIQSNIVLVYELDNCIIGYYSLAFAPEDKYYGSVFVEHGWWLDHMFIRPEFIGKGIGTELMNHLNGECLQRSITELRIFSDPHSAGFYEKFGAVKIRDSLSSIEGRIIPVYLLNISRG